MDPWRLWWIVVLLTWVLMPVRSVLETLATSPRQPSAASYAVRLALGLALDAVRLLFLTLLGAGVTYILLLVLPRDWVRILLWASVLVVAVGALGLIPRFVAAMRNILGTPPNQVPSQSVLPDAEPMSPRPEYISGSPPQPGVPPLPPSEWPVLYPEQPAPPPPPPGVPPPPAQPPPSPVPSSSPAPDTSTPTRPRVVVHPTAEEAPIAEAIRTTLLRESAEYRLRAAEGAFVDDDAWARWLAAYPTFRDYWRWYVETATAVEGGVVGTDWSWDEDMLDLYLELGYDWEGRRR